MKTNQELILLELAKHPAGISGNKLHEFIQKYHGISLQGVRIGLWALAKSGAVKKTKKKRCECCGISLDYFQIKEGA